MKILILEDDAIRMKHFKSNFMNHIITHVETASDAIMQLSNNKFDAVMLDHDLGGNVYVLSSEPNTGYQVAKWLSENPDRTPEQVFIHSLNPVGAKLMHELIPNSVLAPFIWLKEQI